VKKIEPPKFLSDLYRDLRDRHLLLPVAAVLVAIVAVPVLLKSDSSAAPAPPPAAAGIPEEATAVAPAVLVDDAGVRDYRKRLAQLKATNPFEQKFELPTPDSVALQGSGGGTEGDVSPSGAGGGSGSSVETTVTDTLADADAAGASVTTDTTVTEPDGAEVNTETTEETKPPKPEVRFYAGRIDVTVGELGNAKRVDGVRYLDLLPSENKPVAAFLGLAEGGERAVFLLSRDVVETDGDGSCAPKKPAPCQYVTLQEGDEQTFKYADGTTYRLRLLKTHIVHVPDPRGQHGDDQSPTATD
jgi:hypothetical protein